MNPPGRLALSLALAVQAGCARNPASQLAVPSAVLENEPVRRTMLQALTADAAGTAADSLYLIGATIVADGLSAPVAPRFAGIQPGGTVAVTGSTLEITPYLAWGVLDYRWTPATGGGGQAAFGRATFVLERVGGSWRIKHVHSSSLRAAGPR